MEGAIGGPKSLDSDFDESSKLFEPTLDVTFSLCGAEISDEAFQNHSLRYEDACADPKIFENPNLVVKVNGKFYDWASACTLVMTYAAFNRHLPRASINDKKRLSDAGKIDDPNSGNAEAPTAGGYSSWFSWRRSSQTTKKSPNSSFIKSNCLTLSNETTTSTKNIFLDLSI